MTSDAAKGKAKLPSVLFVVESALGGTGEVVLELAGSLHERGHRIGLLCSPRRMDPRFEAGVRELTRRGIEVERAPLHPYRGPAGLARTRRALGGAASRHDVIHLHGAWGAALGRPSLWRTGRPLVYSPHGGAFHPGRGLHSAARPIERLLARRTSVFIVSSSYEEAQVRAVVGGRARIVSIPHGRRGETAARPRPTAEGRLRFGVVGRLVAGKRLDLALEALALARDDVPGVELVVVGDGPARAELAAQVDRGGLQEAVTFLGFVEDKQRIYASFDVLLLPSDSEAAPLVVAEAQAAAVPAIVTDSGGGTLAVNHDDNGVVVPRGDARAMADQMIAFARSPATYARYALRAAATFDSYPTWDAVAGRYSDVYAELSR
jgi:L-malate glycosyltransferase